MDLETLLFFRVPALLLAISIHEYAHAVVAYRLGDPTPKYQGRITLNPLAHLDPLGAIMLVVFQFGWARPVLVNPSYFRNPRQGGILVAVAGPLANLTLAYVLGLLLQWLPGVLSYPTSEVAADFLWHNISLNLVLAAFNLIPIPPLDGSRILKGLLPTRGSLAMEQLERYGPLLLVALVATGTARFFMDPILHVLAAPIRGLF